jgi:hypothetical protein
MTQTWYCPRCRSELQLGAECSCCPKCNADFGPTAIWGPVSNPNGQWEARPEGVAALNATLGHALGRVFFRLIGGLIIWAVFGFIFLISAIPYGGGDRDRLALWFISTFVLAIWALWPLVHVRFKRVQAIEARE